MRVWISATKTRRRTPRWKSCHSYRKWQTAATRQLRLVVSFRHILVGLWISNNLEFQLNIQSIQQPGLAPNIPQPAKANLNVHTKILQSTNVVGNSSQIQVIPLWIMPNTFAFLAASDTASTNGCHQQWSEASGNLSTSVCEFRKPCHHSSTKSAAEWPLRDQPKHWCTYKRTSTKEDHCVENRSTSIVTQNCSANPVIKSRSTSSASRDQSPCSAA